MRKVSMNIFFYFYVSNYHLIFIYFVIKKFNICHNKNEPCFKYGTL